MLCQFINFSLIDGPPCIILEYAVHGCLKDLLWNCRQNVLNSQLPLKLITAPEDSDDKYDHSPTVDYIINPGQIYEDDIYHMAEQILKGLAHLEKQQVQFCQ